jgi:hypothetical protein
MTRSAPGTQRLRGHCVEPRGNSHGHGQNELHDAMMSLPLAPGFQRLVRPRMTRARGWCCDLG